MSEIRGVVFDLDGTLIDGYEAIHASLTHAMVSLGVEPWSAAEVRRHVGRGLEALVGDAVGEARVADGVRLFRERYGEVCIAGTRVLPGVAATLAELARRGYRMGVATNKLGRFSRAILEAFELVDPLPVCLGPEDVGAPKPDPIMVRTVLERLELTATQAIYVGDMPIDVETARAAGLPVWVVPTGSATRAELDVAGADRVLERFEDLLGLLA